MTKNNNEENDDIQINLKDSSDGNFHKASIPKYNEIQKFEDEIENDARDEEIDQGLSEIYQDDDGELVDVHKLEKIRRKGFLLSLVNFLFVVLIIGGASYYFYENWYKNASLDEASVTLELEGDQEVVLGEDFEYTIKYKNNSRAILNNVRLNVTVPSNFILENTEPESQGRGLWEIGDLSPSSAGEVKIKGQMLGSVEESGILSAYLTYNPEGLSSEYKKDSYITTKIIDTGVSFDFDFINTALIGETEEVLVMYTAQEANFINNFRMSLVPDENIKNIDYYPEEGDELSYGEFATYSIDRPGVWSVEGVVDEDLVIPVRFQINEKNDDRQKLLFRFDKKGPDGQYYEFYTKEIEIDVMKNNLNLTMIVNGERDAMGVDFGETLNYSIVYNNKGDSSVSDVVIMAVLEGEYLDWTTLQDENFGREKGNTITWSKEEIPELAVLEQDEEGMIDFSISVLDIGAVDLDSDHVINSYARFSIGDKEEVDEEVDNKSNTVSSVINSDLEFTEALRYFNEDNIPVGSGPNPPRVGEETGYKVYWTINNNLHELNKLGASVKLPDYVEYDGKNRATVGSIIYSSEAHEVTWNIGRLPTTVYQASAEFSIKVKPSEDDLNKIMVLLPGSEVQAVDAETKESLTRSTKAKTSKLEDDEIGQSDGIVERGETE